MHARVFRRITNRFSTISKTALLALFLFANVFGIVGTTFAQTPEEVVAQRQLAYQNYLTLFTPDSGLIGTVGLTRDNTSNDVIGFKFNISLNTNKTGDPWDYIKEDGTLTQPNAEDVFLIRLCNTSSPTQCWLNTIPYSEDADGYTYDLIAREYGTGPTVDEPVRSQSISNFSGFNYNHSNTVNASSGLSGYRYKYTRNNIGTKNEGSIFSYEPIKFQKGSSVEATLWYCAANTANETGATAYDGNGLNDTVATFDTLCGGASYFRIGQPQRIDIPTTDDAVAALVNNNPSTKQVGAAVPEDNLPTCTIGITDSKIVGCLAQGVYYIIYWPIAWVAGLFGSLFDFFIGYSVSDESYRYAFAVNGWKLVRDIANIMFIVIMVYVGFAAVFSFGGKGGSTMRRVVPILILNALIINFSLFATRTVIDISNITARIFYSRMVVCAGECTYTAGSSVPNNIKRGLGGHWPLSEKIVSAFSPQKMFGTISLTPKEPSPNGSKDPLNSTAAGQEIDDYQRKGFNQGSAEYAGYYALVSIIAAALMLGIAAMFFNVTFMFVGRVIGLYMAMIFSPFAFLTRGGMPLFNIDRFSWKNWVSDLFNYAALAPVFTFFLYIVYSFLNTDIVKQIGVEDTTGGFFGTVLSIVIPMLFIYYLVKKGVDIAKKYSGEFGNAVQGFVSGAVGGVGGVVGGGIGLAAGAGALLGRNVVGRGMKFLGEKKWGGSETLANRLATRAPESRMARIGNKALNWGQTSSWDARNTKLNKNLETGVNKMSGGQVKLSDKFSGLLGIDKSAGKGGFLAGDKARAEKRKKELDERIQYSHLGDEEAEAVWKKHKERSLAKAGEHNWESHIDEEEKIKPLVKEHADLTTKEKKLSEQKATIVQDLAKAKAEGRTADVAKHDADRIAKDAELTAVKDKLATATKTLEDTRASTVADLKKDGGYKESAAYKKAQSGEQERLDKYGTIKNGKALEGAMRAEYAENLKANSFWLKDGKPRFETGALGIAAAAALAAALPGIGTIIGALIIKNMTEQLANNAFGNINKKAVDGMLKFKKSQGKASKEGRLTAKLDAAKELLQDALTKHPDPAMREAKLDEVSDAEIEKGIVGKIFEIEDEIKELSSEIKAETNPEKKRGLEIKEKLLQKKITHLNNAIKDRDSAQSELDKFNDSKKKEEGDKEKKDDKKDEKKDDK
ncbi:MAG TPA: hypothetical protein VGE18_03285 [Candidatus Paceibacterota bacterium]